MKPLAIDLYAGLGGWTDGLLAEGWGCIGFDVERHEYDDAKYPAQLVIQDVLTLHGSQFRDADLIVASPPCQEFSYMAMPWSRAKAKIGVIEACPTEWLRLCALFDACFRIQREACEAAGRHIPLIVENVRGAQRWVGRSRWNFGSFHLWGDVPALMPMTAKSIKVATMGAGWYPPDHPKHVPGLAFNTHAERAIKNSGGSWFNIANNTTSGKGRNPDGRKTVGHLNQRDGHSHTRHLTNQAEHDGTKIGGDWFSDPNSTCRKHGSKSSARKAASAMIAKIPLPLSTYIARTFRPQA